MSLKIKKKLFLKDMPKNIKKRFAKALKEDIADAIVEEIISGKSPVKGKNFPEYSEAYAKKKGRDKPADLLESGKMLESIQVKQDTKGRVEIGFTDKKAVYHDKEGPAGNKKKIRRMLPRKRGETFNKKLTRLINKILNKAVKKEVNRR